MKDVRATLGELFAAERAVRKLHAALAAEKSEVVLGAIDEALAEITRIEDREEAALRLVRLAELLGELGGPPSIDRLIDLMGSEEPEARVVAGEALQELAYARFKEVAQGVERALARLNEGNPALTELPYMLAEVPEGGVMVLLKRFLQRKDAEPVAAAIEALVEIGDPEAIAVLEPLANDKRTVSMEELDEGAAITIGELAVEAVDLLGRVAGAS
jgi:HEAT repeat protein